MIAKKSHHKIISQVWSIRKIIEVPLFYFCFMLLLSVHAWVFGLETEFFHGVGEDRTWGNSVKRIDQIFAPVKEFPYTVKYECHHMNVLIFK